MTHSLLPATDLLPIIVNVASVEINPPPVLSAMVALAMAACTLAPESTTVPPAAAEFPWSAESTTPSRQLDPATLQLGVVVAVAVQGGGAGGLRVQGWEEAPAGPQAHNGDRNGQRENGKSLKGGWQGTSSKGHSWTS